MTDEEAKIVCKHLFPQGDDYHVRKTNSSKWEMGYINDYPLQHGEGKKILLPESVVLRIYRLIEKQEDL